MRVPNRRLAHLVAGCVPLLGQTSHLTPVKAPGDMVTLVITADSQPARAPAGLKWEVLFPAQVIEMQADAEAGKAAVDSGKSLQCVARRPYLCYCILAGGQNPVADGPIAIFHFKIRTTAAPQTITLRIQRAEAITAESKELSLNDTEAVVVIK
jgi:hypothetical protein